MAKFIMFLLAHDDESELCAGKMKLQHKNTCAVFVLELVLFTGELSACSIVMGGEVFFHRWCHIWKVS